MDCFYAAIEERDNPDLRGKPVGVGGNSRRGVLTTANYEARKFGCHSAMPVFQALEKCPQLLVVPTRFPIYKRDSAHLREIFSRFTEKLEPLSLDEAFLDVSHHEKPASHLAEEIRTLIRTELQLTASAGIAPNKLIAKIASDLRKPDGQFTVRPSETETFMENLPVGKIPGVGAVTREKINALGVQTCGHYRSIDKFHWAKRFGTFGAELYERCWGRDDREVSTDRSSKTLSIENTFRENFSTYEELETELTAILEELAGKLASRHAHRSVKTVVVKLKFADFERTTAEKASPVLDFPLARDLLREALRRGAGRHVRLLGAGVRFAAENEESQLEMFLP